MRLHSECLPKEIDVCSDCKFVDDETEMDKCPYCGNDDWIIYTKEENDDD